MSRSGRILLIAVAWVAPLLWLAVALTGRPSDGTLVTSPTAVFGESRWDGGVVVIKNYGDSPLRVGDLVRSVDGTPPTLARAAAYEVGDVAAYAVTRPGAQLDRTFVLEVELTRYPIVPALFRARAHVVLALGLLVAGTFLVWRKDREPLATATLALGALGVMSLSAFPFGLQAIETVEGNLWRHLVGEVAFAVGMGVLLVAAVSFPSQAGWLSGRPVRLLAPWTVPFLAYGVWAAGFAVGQTDTTRQQALLDLSFPTAVASTVLATVVVNLGFQRAREREGRIAVRLMLLAGFATLLTLVVIDFLPTAMDGQALLPWRTSGLVLVPLLLVCWVAAVTQHRLLELDAPLRRSLLYLGVVTVVGAAFLAAMAAVSATTATSAKAMLTGGLVAAVALPLAIPIRRQLARIGYGQRASPYQVVSTLRQLDQTTGPEAALQQTLVVLTTSLNLSYAHVEADGLSVSLGQSRGETTTVLLEVAGTRLGRLDLEVSPLRAQFGPQDRRLLEDVGSQVGALVQALTATRELQRARERLVTAREEERRRLRRDLHDGLGPSLASLQMRLEVARELIERDADAAERLVADLAEQAHVSIEEVRRLVEGLRPPVLDQLGLVAALRQRADQHKAPGTLTWTVEADELGDLPAAVEVAAYRVAVEAVNNALRHSQGTTCCVTLHRAKDAFEVEIRDDGVGVPEDHRIGVGFGSMRERAEELGGTLTVTGARGRGTTVTARFPLSTEGAGWIG